MRSSGKTVSPAEKRSSGRALRIALRTVHILTFSVLLGGHWFGVPRAELLPWLRWSVLSGAALMALELRSGFDWFLQLAGGLTLAKLVLLGLVPAFPGQARVLLLLVAVIGSVGSHLPSSLRHYKIIGSREIERGI